MSRPVVLIADANIHIRCFLQRELVEEGFDVIPAKVHTEVLSRLEALRKPDLVLLDRDIPFIGGVSTLLRLRGKAPRVPVVVYTVYVEDVEDPVLAQADAVVEKTPDPAFLIQTIRRLLGREKKPKKDRVLHHGERPGPGKRS